MNSLTITPAYLRDYKSKRAVKKDLLAYYDFKVADISSKYDGRPGNLPQFIEALGPNGQLKVRYDSHRKVAVFQIKELT